MTKQENVERCGWVAGQPDIYIEYHDKEWGVPVHDDRLLFQKLVLDGAQAGLSWLTILKKQQNYIRAFDGFDIGKVASYGDDKISGLLSDPGIVRNRLKIESAIKNARAVLRIRDEFGSFDNYLWGFVDFRTIQNNFESIREIPAKTKLSDRISADMKKRGMGFVGSTIIYAYIQAIGMVNDHTLNCFRHRMLGGD
ncbi:MAG: DNA-3-methyladenine glycosylase I [Clostridia bacterium]|nr:DNA-3-methyladenine glycosylase I [Clostridia bacterium]